MKVKYCSILKWLLILSPIVDNINGYLLLTKGASNISGTFKTIIFLFCLNIILFKGMRGKKGIGIICMAMISILQLAIFEIRYSGGFIYNISIWIKLLTPVVIVMAVHVLEIYDQATVICIDKVSRFYCWFFPLSLIIPSFFNMGFSTYRSGEGSKGFYFSGNEIAITMIVVFTLELAKYQSDKTKANFLNMILGAISILYIGTKTSYITLVISILVMFYSEKNINKKVLNAVLIIPIIFGGLWFVINNVNVMAQSIYAIVWRYRSRTIRGMSFLFSGRELRINRAIELVYGKNLISNMLIGIGPNAAENNFEILIEMDLVDLFIRFGIIVSAVIIAFYMKNVKQIIRGKNEQYMIGAILTCGASVFAGHMLFSPMVSIVLMILFLKNDFEVKLRQYKRNG